MVAIKDALHRLIDKLPAHEWHAAQRFLQYLSEVGSDPMMRALMEAPEDDEPTTPEEDAGAAGAWAEYLRGEALSSEEAKRRLLG